jgi:hypothetical protein
MYWTKERIENWIEEGIEFMKLNRKHFIGAIWVPNHIPAGAESDTES